MADRYIKWMDGSIDSEPPGKLLSDNVNYYGDCILTNLHYKYNTQLTGKGDTESDIKDFIGKRLIDGITTSRYGKTPVSGANGLLEVVFDLNDIYIISEFDLLCVDIIKNLEILSSVDGEVYNVVFKEGLIEKKPLIRCRFDSTNARFIKFKISGEENIRLYQIWIWGDSLESDATNETLKGNDKFVFANSIAQESVMGMSYTAFTDVEGFYWNDMLQKNNRSHLTAVWSEVDAYDSLGKKPILPSIDKINKPVYRRICKNGSEVVCLALTNTDSNDVKDVEVEIINSTGIRTKMYTVGVMESRWYGTAASPLFNNECCISKPLMRKYIKNSSVIEDFPKIHLPVAGTCLIWIVIYADDKDAGKYSFTVKAGNSEIQINTEILPISLKPEKHGIMVWSSGTYMFPFEWSDRAKIEAEYRNEIGVNIYHGWNDVSAEALKSNPDILVAMAYLGKIGSLIYQGKITPEQVEAEGEEYFKNLLLESINKSNELGLTNKQWFLALPDEPGKGNIKALTAAVKICKKLYPEIMIYINPAFWKGFENGAVSDDAELYECLKEIYEYIDISVPLLMNLNDRPNALEKLFTAEREYNGQYLVSGQHMCSDRSDLLQLSRTAAWESISRGLNVWGFYSYFVPRLNTWDNKLCMDRHVDFTINYQCVHAGVNGPVPTRASEGIREGYQDFQIMQLLKEKDIKTYKKLQQEFLNGNRDYKYFRNTAIDALLK